MNTQESTYLKKRKKEKIVSLNDMHHNRGLRVQLLVKINRGHNKKRCEQYNKYINNSNTLSNATQPR